MRKYYFICTLVILTFTLKAQKTPDIQSAAMAAPANVRIDGKATEWGDIYAADNKRTSLSYSLANDDKNLYLLIRGAGSATVNKIMMGGITFTVNTDGKKKDKDAMSITYPLVKRAPRGQTQGGRQGGGEQVGIARAGSFGGGNFGGGQNRGAMTAAQRDSVSLVQHKASLAGVKEIKVVGFQNISDSLISIYNEYGLKAMASFDNSGALIYELAVPLKLLELSTDQPATFMYQLKVNGLVMTGFGGNNGGGNRGGNVTVTGGGMRGGFGGGSGNFGGGNNIQDMMSPTDFWGKYTLFKK